MISLQPDPADDRDSFFALYFSLISIHLIVDLKNVKNTNASEPGAQTLPEKWLPNPLSFQRFANEKLFSERGWF
jgi:hypothetical protein